MSATIDEKVVSMQFDNRNFESNVKTSLGTIERLKQSLNFSGQAKGLEDINASVKRINVSPLSQGLEKVKSQFSALEVVGITALANITNSAVNTGKRMISALTIDPVKTGFHEYETQMGAIQTILANTQHEGTNLEQVNKALDELNTYSDKTIYNFTEMTRNIGTFTAAGVKLQTSVDSIKGIANLAAVSGSTSQQASTAMYQLSQALAAGKVSLMDWNSVVNAGMGGKIFQDALVRTSELLGTGAKNAIKMYGSFRESLTKGEWLTTEVLTETLKQLSGAYTEADLIQQGFSKAQAKEIAAMAKTAEDAATKVKTFTQLWDTMKEPAQSGWAKTWQIVIGDFEEAKELLTGISDWFRKKIQASADRRNNLLESALGGGESKWKDFEKRLNDAGVSTDDFQNKLEKTAKQSGVALDSIIEKEGSLAKAFSSGKLSTSLIVDSLKSLDEESKKSVKSTENMTDKLEYFQKVVDDVWGGKYKTAPERQELLTKAGYKYAEVQSLVNKTVDGHRLTLEDLSDVQLKSIGYTDKEIKKIHELAVEAEKAGSPLNKLINSLDRKSGRELFWDSIKNVVLAIEKPLNAIQTAWSKVFSPINADQIYNFVSALEAFTEKLIINEENIPKLEKSFEGLFTIIKFFTTFIGGSARIAFKVFNTLLELFGFNILDVTAWIGDAIVKFEDWMKTNNFINRGLTKVVGGIKTVAITIKDWFLAFKELPVVRENLERLKQSASDTFNTLRDHFGETGERLWDFVSGLKDLDGISLSNIGKVLSDFKTKILDYFFDAGDKITGFGESIQDFANAILNNMGPVGDFLKMVKDKLVEIYEVISGRLSTVDTGSLLSFGITVGLLVMVAKLAGLLKTILIDLPLKAHSLISKAVQPFALIQESIAKISKAFSTYLKAQAIKSIAISIAILAGSVFLLAQLNPTQLWNSVAAVVALIGFMAALIKVSGDYGPDKGVDFGKMALSVLAIGSAVLLIAIALKQIESIDPDRAVQAFGGLASIIFGIISVIGAYTVLSRYSGAKESIDDAGNLMLKMSASLVIMAYAMKMIASMNPGDIAKALLTIGGLELIIAGLIASTQLAGKRIRFVGTTLLQISAAIGILVLVMKLIASMEPGDIAKGLSTIGGLEALIAGFMAITNLSGKNIRTRYIGKNLIQMSVALGLMVGVIKLISYLSPSEITKGITVMGLFELLFAGMIGITRLAGPNPVKIGGTLLAMSGAIAILAGTAIILGMISIKNLAKGIIAIEFLSLAMATMIKASRGANDVKSSLIVMTVAIAIMAASLAALSFIEPSKLITSAAALGGIMSAFALMLNQLKGLNVSTKDIAALGALVGVTALLALIIGVMSSFEYQSSTLENATALSVLLLAMSGVIFVLDKIGKIGKDVFVGVAALLAMAVPLIAFVGVLAVMQYVNKATENVMALTVLATALTLLLIPLSLVGILIAATGGLAAIGIIALLAMAVPLIAFVGVLAVMQYVNKATENTKLLTDLMTVMADVLVKIAIVGPLAAIGVAALYGLTGIMIALGALATGVGALSEAWPDFEKFLDKGIPILEKLAYGLGSVIGNFISGLANGIMQMLPALGKALSDFMLNLVPFITISKTIDDKVAKGSGIIVSAILGLTVASFLNGIAKIISFGTSSLVSLGEELSTFMIKLKPFISGAGSLDATAIEGVKTLADAILIITAANLLENINNFFGMFGGQNSIEKFSSGLTTLGTGLNGFVSKTGSLSKADVESANNAAAIVKTLAEAAQSIPNSGGLLGAIFGENDLTTWSKDLGKVGTGLKGFIGAITSAGITEESATTAGYAADIINKLAEAAKSIPNSGGLIAEWIGDNEISTWASKLPVVAVGIGGFISILRGFKFTADDVSYASNVADIVNKLAEAGKAIPNSGGKIAEWIGDNDIADWADKLPAVAEGVVKFVKKTVGLTANDLNTGRSITGIILDLSQASMNFTSFGVGQLSELGIVLPDLGTNISTFVSTLYSVSGRVLSAQMVVNQLRIMLTDLESFVDVDFSKLGSTLKDFAEDGVKQFTDSFTNDTTNNLVVNSVTAMINKAYKTVSELTSPGSTVYNSFRIAGTNLLQGFLIGMNTDSIDAEKAGARLGHRTLVGLENSIDSHSPSREAYKRGVYFCQGYADAFRKNESLAYDSGANVGEQSKKGLSAAISKIKNMLSTDIDYQPTIQPVLDLTNVQNGMSDINSMLNFNKTVPFMANINGIGGNIANNKMNNSDIITALNKLGKDIGQIQTNQYNFGSITYSDNEEISNAIQVLVRASRIGGRV